MGPDYTAYFHKIHFNCHTIKSRDDIQISASLEEAKLNFVCGSQFFEISVKWNCVRLLSHVQPKGFIETQLTALEYLLTLTHPNSILKNVSLQFPGNVPAAMS